jgi:hypothetical protein
MYKRDYEIRIKADSNDNVYWQLLRKGEPAACNEKEMKMVADICTEIRDKIVMAFDEKDEL